MKVSRSMVLAMLLLAVSSAILVDSAVVLKFPITIKVRVREPLVLTGPTPANGTWLASSSKNFTLSFKNFAGPVCSIVYFVTNGTGWNCPACGYNTQPFTMIIGSQVTAPAEDVGGGSYCGSPVGDYRCSYALTVSSGQSTVIAILPPGSTRQL